MSSPLGVKTEKIELKKEEISRIFLPVDSLYVIPEESPFLKGSNYWTIEVGGCLKEARTNLLGLPAVP